MVLAKLISYRLQVAILLSANEDESWIAAYGSWCKSMFWQWNLPFAIRDLGEAMATFGGLLSLFMAYRSL